MTLRPSSTRRAAIAGSLLALIGLARQGRAEVAHVIPAPAADEAPGVAAQEVAVFAGGCSGQRV